MPSAMIEPSAGELAMPKASAQPLLRPASRLRLISYRPTAKKGAISAKPEASGEQERRHAVAQDHARQHEAMIR